MKAGKRRGMLLAVLPLLAFATFWYISVYDSRITKYEAPFRELAEDLNRLDSDEIKNFCAGNHVLGDHIYSCLIRDGRLYLSRDDGVIRDYAIAKK